MLKKTSHNIRLIATDLDGTLLRDDKSVSETDMHTLEILGKMNIIRVAATGRSMYSVRKVIPENFPFDYIVFSTGAGLYDWKKQELLASTCLEPQQVKTAAKVFFDNNLDFTIHKPVPDNHYFIFNKSGLVNTDFEHYCDYYNGFCERWDGNIETLQHATQLLSVMPVSQVRYETLMKKLKGFKVIRTTSPVNDSFMWVEVFHPKVSKGHTLKKLCRKLGINPENTISVGNDFNDLDMLHFTGHSFVVDNAHNDLKMKFRTSTSHLQNGFTHAVEKVFDLHS